MPRKSRLLLLFLLIVVISFPVGMRLAGETGADTALGRVSFSLRPALSGGAELYVPITEWGMHFRASDVPVLVRVEPRSVERDAALEVAGGDRSLIEATKRDLRGGAIKAGLINAVTILLVTGLLGLLLAAVSGWPLIPTALGAVGSSALAIGLVALVGWLTFSPESLSSPSLYARGAELKQLIETVERERSDKPGSYGSNFERVLRGASSFLAASPGRPRDTREILLASDIHNNAPALEAIGNLAGSDPVFMPGDFGFQGSDAEAALLAPAIGELGQPVVATSGNHDSSSLMLEMSRQGVIVLGQRGRLMPDGRWRGPVVREISGLRVAAYRDPLEWRGRDPEDPERIFSFGEFPDGDDRQMKAEEKIWSWWQSLSTKPDVLLLHQPELAEGLARRISAEEASQELTILVGHDHKQWLARYGAVVIVDGGSSGAGGLFGIGSESSEVATLHFRLSSDDLEAVDFIAVEPLRGSSRAERVIVSELCGSPCRYPVEKATVAGIESGRAAAFLAENG